MSPKIRSLLILIDGLGDEPNSKLAGLTPWTFAAKPHMDLLAQAGSTGQLSICLDEFVPESCNCILRLLGVAKEDMPTNRTYLELLAYNKNLSDEAMVLRCNLAVRDARGRLVGFNGIGLNQDQMQEAAAVCNALCEEIEFLHLSEYRNLLVLKKEPDLLSCNVAPPHESLGEQVEILLKEVKDKSSSIGGLLEKSEKYLSMFNHDGLHYILYPWGAATKSCLPSFEYLHGLTGGVVCKAEIVRGIAIAMGMKVLTPLSATGDIDTVIADKARATLELLQQKDFILTHFNGTDEAAHRYDAVGKADFISRIDQQFLRPIIQTYHDPLKIVICGDHCTSSVTGRHSVGAVPVVAGVINTPLERPALVSYKDILRFLFKLP